MIGDACCRGFLAGVACVVWEGPFLALACCTGFLAGAVWEVPFLALGSEVTDTVALEYGFVVEVKLA